LKKEWWKAALPKVKALWEGYRELAPIPLSPIISYDRPSQQPVKELDAFDEIAQTLGKYTRPASQDEYEDYISGEPYDIGNKTTALFWWSQELQRKRWPRLSWMAMDLLSIPAMSAEPERVFSGARRTISWDRAQMEPETLEIIECLKHWKRSGILNKIIETEE
jgi:hypothetical protein